MTEGLITNTGKRVMMQRHYLASPTVTQVSRFKIGRGDTPPTVTDTDLEDQVPFSGTEQVDICDSAAGWGTSGNANITENIQFYKKGTGSLNLIKVNTSSAICTYDKVTTNLTFDADKEFSMWLYIRDVAAYDKLAITGCWEMRFGSGATNYYAWTFDKVDLAPEQWNLFQKLKIADATVVGTPDLGNMDYTEVVLTAVDNLQLWDEGEFMMDDIKLVLPQNYWRDFEVGYPNLNLPDINCTMRMRIATSEAIGYSLTEVGIFNTDAVYKMESRDTFAPISKTITDEIVFVAKTTFD